MSAPLAGVRVIEIAQEIQGPYAAQMLGDLGADVIKLELPEIGDLSRHMLARLITNREDTKLGEFSHYFLAMNKGKRSITVDLKSDGGKTVLARLLERADVLLTNYRPGVLDRLGFGYEELHTKHPRLIYACGTSWGPTGPWVTRPSRDTLAQAAGGLMTKNGLGDDPPLPCGALVADHSAALSLMSGVLAALYAREKTGVGQKVDASIYATVLALQPMEIAFTGMTDVEPRRAGRGHPFLHGVWGSFRTADGWICLAGVDAKRWDDFCRVMNIEDVREDPECADAAVRHYHGDKIQARLDQAFPARTTEAWMEALTAIDILVTPVEDFHGVLESEQARANGYVRTLSHPVIGKVDVVGNPITLSETPLVESEAPPELGQHTEELLLEAGFEWEEIEKLRSEGAL